MLTYPQDAETRKKQISFAAGTLVEMADGTSKPIESVVLGDMTKGGKVFGIMQHTVLPGEMYFYKGIHVAGSTPVNDEGVWRYVRESSFASRAPDTKDTVTYVFACGSHRIYVQGVEFSDFPETGGRDPVLVGYLEKLFAYHNTHGRLS